MKSVLIVDDEKLIRQSLQRMILESDVPVEIVFECRNGEEALEILSRKSVDLVFTDIEMPHMNGIELVRQIRQFEKKPMVVVVTGHDDFNYVVEMLRLGARDYILKPADPDKIAQVMQELNDELNQHQSRMQKEFQIEIQQLRRLISGDFVSEEERRIIQEKYNSCFYSDKYVVCCAYENASVDAKNVIRTLDDVDDGMVYVLPEKDIGPFLRTECREGSVGIGKAHAGIHHLHNAYQEALYARKRAFVKGNTVQYEESEKEIPEALREEARKLLTSQSISQGIQLVGTDHVEKLNEHWQRFLLEVELGRIKPEEFLLVMENSLKNIDEIYGEQMDEALRAEGSKLKKPLAYLNLAQYSLDLMKYLNALNERCNLVGVGSRSQHKMQMAVDYIRQNYSSNLNMAVVSNYLSMNYSLFSYSFKQYTGKTFVNYLKELRIEEAKRLLVETDERIADISYRVGYDNEKHFMKTFKNQCGVSPTEYRKNMKKDY